MYKNTDCGAPRSSDIGKQITVAGWVHRRRDHGNLVFVDLRDRTGILQIVFNPEISDAAHRLAEEMRSEWVVQATGTIRARLPGATNPNLDTGEVELIVDESNVLNRAATPPFEVEDDTDAEESTRMAFRYIDIRRPEMLKRLQLRHRVTHLIWDDLTAKDFTQVETPILIKSTPEGARDYVVPSRVRPGSFYALPQSPQQMKQILMVAGVERYFQIAKCFRDEDLRADRQPEHTQLDLEMSFVHQEDVMSLVEGLYTRIVREIRPDARLETPFMKLSYDQAVEKYGSDKPDTRYGLEMSTITEIAARSDARVFQSVAKAGGTIRAFSAPGCAGYTRRQTDQLIDVAKSAGAHGLVYIAIDKAATSIADINEEHIRSPLKSYLTLEIIREIAHSVDASPGDLVLIVAGTQTVANNALSALRTEMAGRLDLIDPDHFKFAWVFDFPLFERDDDRGAWSPAHHVFSAPKREHIPFIESDPGRVYADLFDLTCNGVELGSGSIRIHDPELQMRVFNVIGYSDAEIEERFGHLLKAFKYGAPPHGGMGLGLDRITAMLAGQSNIREVIAFPKTQSAWDPLFDAPSQIADEQLEELGIAVETDE